MKTTFYIELNMKTADGFERFGCFDLGCDREFALKLFSALEGGPPRENEDVMHLDLVEKKQTLPVNIQVLSCSIGQLCTNVKIISKELFKRMNLDIAF